MEEFVNWIRYLHLLLPKKMTAKFELELELELELGTWNLELGTWNLELGTWNLELGTWNLTVPKSINAILDTLSPGRNVP
ncbi:MAG: hypothetical protein ACYCOU_02990 [Sulfobacillus sp.]